MPVATVPSPGLPDVQMAARPTAAATFQKPYSHPSPLERDSLETGSHMQIREPYLATPQARRAALRFRSPGPAGGPGRSRTPRRRRHCRRHWSGDQVQCGDRRTAIGVRNPEFAVSRPCIRAIVEPRANGRIHRIAPVSGHRRAMPVKPQREHAWPVEPYVVPQRRSRQYPETQRFARVAAC